MKIQRIVSILFFIGFCVSAIAQDIIVTKDSRTIMAEEVVTTPSVIKYKVYGKPNSPVYSIPVKEVRTILFDDGNIYGDTVIDIYISKKPQRPFITGTTIHWRIGSSFSYNINNPLHSIDPLKVSMGWQFNDYVYIGMGLGGTYYPDIVYENDVELVNGELKEYFDEIPKYKLSGFGIFRFSCPITPKVIPFVDIEAGVSACPREWGYSWFATPYLSAGFGFCFSHFEISGGYEYYKLPLFRMYKPYESWSYFDESSHSNGTLDFGNIYIKIAAKFGYLYN